MRLTELPPRHGTRQVLAPGGLGTTRECGPTSPHSLIGPPAALSFTVLLLALDVSEFLGAVVGIDLDLFNVLVGGSIPLTFVVTLACLHEATPPGRRLWTLLGLVFASMWATVSLSVYFLQLTVVRFAEEQGRAVDVALVSFGDLDRTSAAWALDVAGWGIFLAAALFLVSPALVGDGRQRLGRWALRLSGISMVLLAAGFAAGSEVFQLVAAGLGWMVGLPVAGVVLASILRSPRHTGPMTP
jgi:hypothetical protein